MDVNTCGKPPLKKSRFTEFFILENGLDRQDFKEWLLWPGMLFNAGVKWWGNQGRRKRPHEGLDLVLFLDRMGRTHGFDENTRIPAMYDGVIVNILNDFLGSTVIMEHACTGENDSWLCTMYGHTILPDNIYIGRTVYQGEVIATVADAGKAKVDILPHLHISMGWATAALPLNRLDWETIGARDAVTLIDPLWAIDRHCRL